MKTLCLVFSIVSLVSGACNDYIKIEKATCAQACLADKVGICPVSIVVKTGGLHAGTCADKGYTVANGTKTVLAGPCGKLTFDLYNMKSAVFEFDDLFSSDIFLATFDGKAGTSFKWDVVDDPVMGGKSHSQLQVNKTAHWFGQVAIVPFLHAPGFCTIKTDGLNKFPNVEGTSLFKMYAKNNATSQLEEFSLQVETKGGRSGLKQGTYAGNITVPANGAWTEVSSKWDNFQLTWRGEPITGPAMGSQLDQIEQIGVSTFFPGKAGTFDLEIMWMSAGN